MVERVHSTKLPQRCSRDHWEHLWLLVNSRPDTVVPTHEEIDGLRQCHHRATGDSIVGMLPSLRDNGRKYYSVDRKELFGFLQQHGKVCEHV